MAWVPPWVADPKPLALNGRSPAEGPGPKTWGPWCGAGHKQVVHGVAGHKQVVQKVVLATNKWSKSGAGHKQVVQKVVLATNKWSIGGGIEQCRQAAEATGAQLRRPQLFSHHPHNQGPEWGKEDKAGLEWGKVTKARI